MIKIDLSSIPDVIKDIKQELAIELQKYVQNKIKGGVAPPLEKPRADGTTTPLFHKGVLYRSIDKKVTTKDVQVGTGIQYAPHLHLKRPFLEPDEGMAKIIEKVFKKHSNE